MHPLNGALPGPYLPVRVTRGTLVTHRYTYARPPCRTSQYSMIFISLTVALWNDLANPVKVWDWRVSRAGPMLFHWPKLLYPYYSLLLFSLSLLSVYRLVFWAWGLRTDREDHSLSALHCRPFLIIIIKTFLPNRIIITCTFRNTSNYMKLAHFT